MRMSDRPDSYLGLPEDRCQLCCAEGETRPLHLWALVNFKEQIPEAVNLGDVPEEARFFTNPGGRGGKAGGVMSEPIKLTWCFDDPFGPLQDGLPVAVATVNGAHLRGVIEGLSPAGLTLRLVSRIVAAGPGEDILGFLSSKEPKTEARLLSTPATTFLPWTSVLAVEPCLLTDEEAAHLEKRTGVTP